MVWPALDLEFGPWTSFQISNFHSSHFESVVKALEQNERLILLPPSLRVQIEGRSNIPRLLLRSIARVLMCDILQSHSLRNSRGQCKCWTAFELAISTARGSRADHPDQRLVASRNSNLARDTDLNGYLCWKLHSASRPKALVCTVNQAPRTALIRSDWGFERVFTLL